MKRLLIPLILALLLTGCASQEPPAQIAATTLPVYEFTSRLCRDTDLTVTRLVTESVSCLHDYSLNVRQVRAAEAAELIVISGAGLEDFMADVIGTRDVIDASHGIALHSCPENHGHEDHDHHGHSHETDSHIWLSPENAAVMARNICQGLSDRYPEHREQFEARLAELLADIQAVETYGKTQLADLTCRDLVTFHDGFTYLAEAFDLHILEAVEEESGSEASAQELIHLIGIIRDHGVPAIFTETNGSDSAASIISAETGAGRYTLDMAMAGDSWFDAMYHNIDTLKEALG